MVVLSDMLESSPRTIRHAANATIDYAAFKQAFGTAHVGAFDGIDLEIFRRPSLRHPDLQTLTHTRFIEALVRDLRSTAASSDTAITN